MIKVANAIEILLSLRLLFMKIFCLSLNAGNVLLDSAKKTISIITETTNSLRCYKPLKLIIPLAKGQTTMDFFQKSRGIPGEKYY